MDIRGMNKRGKIRLMLSVLLLGVVILIGGVVGGVPSSVDLGTAGNFVILSKSGISTTGTTSITGDIGVSPIGSTAITGFGLIMDSSNEFSTSSLVTGKIYATDYTEPTPTKMTTAISDMEIAYTDAAGRAADVTELEAGNIGGLTLTPGVYKWGTGVLIEGGVTLDCQEDSNAVFIFQIAQDLTVGNGAIITLSNSCQPKNIFWQVAGQTTLGTTSQFKGIILSQTAIAMNTGATLNGRALAQTAVTSDANTITILGLNVPEDYDTIQEAIDAANPGDTINVAAGTYPEDLEINKTLELVGEDKDITIIKGVAKVDSEDWPLANPNIDIQADNVVITGFTIQGPDYEADNYASGMVIHGQNIEIYNNNFIPTKVDADDEMGQAIITYSKTVIETADISGLHIHNNNFVGTGTVGPEMIYINPHTGTGTITISNNTISGAVNIGITVESGNTIVSGNIVDTTISYDIGPYGTYGIRFFDSTYVATYDDITISGNVVQNFKRGVRVGNGGDGTTSITATISENTLTNNDIGIWGRKGNHITANYNDIIDSENYGIKNDGTIEINAINNYWGTNDGEEIATMVSENVDYTPWTTQGGGEVDIPENTPTKVNTAGTNASINLTTSTSQTGSTITVQQYSENPHTGFGTNAELGKFINIQSDIADITKVEIGIHYTDAEIAAAGIAESSLKIYWWDGDSWEFEGSEPEETYKGCHDAVGCYGVDTVNNYVWIVTNHFSDYGAGGDDDTDAPVIGEITNIPQHPKTGMAVEVCTEITDESSFDTLMSCTSDDDLIYQDDMVDQGENLYCLEYSSSSIANAETISCEILATDIHDNEATGNAPNVTFDGLAPTANAGADQTINEGQTIDVDASGSSDTVSDNADMIFEWDWTSDGVYDYTGETATSPAYSEDGIYTVTLRVTDEAGFSSTDTLIITVNNANPTVDLIGTTSPINEDGTTTFTATVSDVGSDDTPLNYVINWEDGTPDSTGTTTGSIEVTHQYLDDDTYTITLTVTDSDAATGSDTVDITVNNLNPVANANGPYSGNEGSAIALSGSATDTGTLDTFTYTWDLDNSGDYKTSGQNVDFSCVDDGTNTVVLQVTDDDGGSHTDSTTVTCNNVNPVVIAPADTSGDEGNEIIIGDIIFTDDGTEDIHDLKIDWGDGSINDEIEDATSPVKDQAHTYSDDETYTVTITVTDDDGGVNSDTLTIIVSDLTPTAAFTSDSPKDEGSVMSFTDTSTSLPDAIVSWSWDFGDSAGTSSEQNPTYTYNDDGTYTVSLTVTDDDGDTDTITHDVTVNNVNPVVIAPVDTSGDEASSITIGDITFTDVGSGDTHTTTINWGDTNTDNLGTVTSPIEGKSHTYSEDGTYEVTITVTDDNGGPHSDTLTITVNDLGPTAEAGANQEISEGQTISVSGSSSSSSPDAITNYEWDWTSDEVYDSTGESTTSPVYNDNGVYTVTLRVTDDDGSTDTDTLTVTVNNVAPEFINLPSSQTAVIGEVFTFTVSATDVGTQDTLTYSLTDAPEGMDIDSTTGEISWTPTYEQKGDHAVSVKVSDDDEDYDEQTLSIHVYGDSISLSTDWNLFSIPLVPSDDDTSIGSVLDSSIYTKADKIWSYENGEWIYNYPLATTGIWSTSDSRIQDIVPGYGYYIKMNEAAEINYDGKKMYGNSGDNADWDFPKPPVVSLVKGWNLIGHYGLNDVNKSNAFTTLSGNYATLMDEDGDIVSTLSPTKGYWLFVTGTSGLEYAPSDDSYDF
ncbi:MAG: PKD domain-containing protein [archaeon]